jgi:PAS domain S-box-containing protein
MKFNKVSQNSLNLVNLSLPHLNFNSLLNLLQPFFQSGNYCIVLQANLSDKEKQNLVSSSSYKIIEAKYNYALENSTIYIIDSEVEYEVKGDKLLITFDDVGLLDSERRAKILLQQTEEIAKTGYWGMDLISRKIVWSEGVFKMLKLDPNTVNLDVRFAIKVVHPEDRGRAIALLDEVIEKGIEYSIHKRFVAADDTVLHIVSKANLVKNVDGTPAKLIGVFQDVTDMVKLNEDILLNESRFRKIFDKVDNLSVQGYSTDGKVIYWNNASEKIYGYKSEDALGKKLWDLIIPDEMKSAAKKAVKEMIAKGEGYPAEELMLKRKDGKLTPVFSNHTVLQLPGKKPELFCIDIDLREQVKAKEKLLNEKRLIEVLIQSIPSVFFLFNQKGEFLLWNKKFEEVSEYSVSELKNIHPLNFFDGKDLQPAQVAIERAFVEGEATVELTFISKSGKFNPYFFTAVAIEYNGENCLMGVGIDIAESKKNLQELNLMLDNTEEAFILTDKKFNIVTFNKQFVLLYSKYFNDAIKKGDNILDYAKPEKRASLFKKYSDVLNGSELESEISITLKSRDKRVVLIKLKPAKNDNDEVVGVFVSAIDITEKKKAQEQVLLNERRFKSLVQEGSGLIGIIDSHGNFTYLSPNYTTYLGDDYQSYLGKNAFELIHPDDIETILNEFELIFSQKKVVSSKYRNKHIDGSWRWFQTIGTNLIEDPAIKGIVLNTIDLTESVKAEEVIKQSESRLRSLIDSQTNYMIRTDLQGNYTFVNTKFMEDYGWLSKKKDSILGANCLESIIPYHHQRVIETVEKCIAEPYKIFQVEIHKPAKDGGVRTTLWDYCCIMNLKNEPKEIQCVGIDITERRNLQLQQALIKDVSLIFNQENSLQNAIDKTLIFLAEYGNFNFGEAWLVNPGQSKLVFKSMYSKDKNANFFHSKTVKIETFKKGEGLPGTVWQNGHIEIWDNIDENDLFIRKKEAKKAGFKSALGLPLLFNKEVVGVLVFGSSNEKNKLGHFENSLNDLIHKLGDIIKQKMAEEELKLFFENAPDILAIADNNGKFRKVNPSFCKVLGYTEEEIVSQPFTNFLHPDDLVATVTEYTETISGERKANNFVNRYRTKSGKYRWISWKSSNVFGADGLAYAYGRDITEKKELEDLYASASKLSKVGSWEIDLVNNQVFWSSITKEIHEVDADYVPILDEGIKFYRKDFIELIKTQTNKAIEESIPFDFEAVLITANGNEKWVRAIGEPELINGKCVRLFGSLQDIHERKQIEQEKTLLLEDRNSILESIDDCFYALDENFCFTYLNKASLEITGLNSEDAIGKNLFEMLPVMKTTNFYEKIHEVQKNKKPAKFELYSAQIDAWFDESIYPKTNGYSVFFRNITERKNAVRDLQISLEENTEILESIGDAFFAVDRDWTVTYWNNQAEKLMGKMRDEIVGHNLWEMYQEAVGHGFYNHYHHAMQTGEIIHFEEYHPATNNYFEVSVYPSKKGLSIYFKDVSVRKIAEEQIRISNERFAKAAEATNDAIWDYNLLTGEMFLGNGFKTLFGYDPKAPYSQEIWMSRVHPDDRSALNSLFNDALHGKTRKIKFYSEYRYQKNNGEYAFVVDRGVVIRDDKRNPIRLIGALQDVTRQKEYEASLRQLNEKLKTRAKELLISNQELEQFAYVASHDLQEPLRMVSSYLKQLEKKYGEHLDDKAKKYLYFAVDGAQRMRQIILDLLEYSRVGKANEEIQSVDINELVSEIELLLRKIIREKKAKIISKNLPVIETYRTPLMQIFSNLIGNSLKYAKDDVAAEIEISCVDLGDKWKFAIKDNGIGIEEEYFNKIFVIFQRLHHKEEYSGTGMGLAIVKKIIETQGGEIWLDSTIGEGTTFYFTIIK